MNDLTEEIAIEKDPSVVLANRMSRIIAFFLDIILVGSFSLMVLTVFIIPKKYPGTMQELWQLSSHPENTQKQRIEKMSPQLKEMVQSGNTIVVLLFWAYFTMSEILLKGSSLGKLIFRIRVVNASTLAPPSMFDSILRSGLKTFSLLVWVPIPILNLVFPIFTLNYFLFFFTSKAQAGHDLLTRTIVIQSDIEEDTEN